MSDLVRTVGAVLDISSEAGCDFELQVAVARSPGVRIEESLAIRHGETLVPFREVDTSHDGVLHLVTLPAGLTEVRYSARIVGSAEIPAPSEADQSLYRRPSRFIESDTLSGFAAAEFDGLAARELLNAVSSWVGTRLLYIPGSSGPTDGAADTLLSGAGVCRDFAHLVTALLRALRVPARLAAVYAPGCDPMDFHAVAEAYVEGRWWALDATTLAPRSTLVRIATGRDAADTAFLTTVAGDLELERSVVTAVANDGLPEDDLNELIAIR